MSELSIMEMVGIAVGTFAVATLANIAASKLTEEEKEKKEKAMYYIVSGVIISIALMTIFDAKIVKSKL
jgi:hypothetical protein